MTVERQQSLLFIGSDEGIPWIGLLGWQVAGNSSATKQASTNASAPSTASNRTFAVNAPLAGSYRFLVIVLELASNAAPSQEFSLWLAVNGSGGNLPGVAGEHFFETPPSVTSAAFLTLVFNLGSSSAAETVRAVTVVASACPSLGICP